MLDSWQRSVHARLAEVEGLVQVLMKPRNGEPWSEEDRHFLWRALRRQRSLSFFLIFRVPGVLPALAWLLDRRRGKPGWRASGRRRGDQAGGAMG